MGPNGVNKIWSISTPLRPNIWNRKLEEAGVLEEFRDVVIGIREGFHLSASFSPLSHIFTPPNHASARNTPDIIRAHIKDEITKGRYVGPFSRDTLYSLIGHFRTSPLGVVPKPNSNEHRIIQDFSFPHNDPTNVSVNSEINIDDFPCDWGLFDQVVGIVISAPPGTQAATFDVDSAYRNIPVHPLDRAHTVVMWEDAFYVDLNVPFGATSSSGVFGRVADAAVHIFASIGIKPVKKWVDDFVFFRSPTPNVTPIAYPFDEEAIYQIGQELGLPWKRKKTRPFAPEFTYLGFLWNIPEATVAITEPKKTKYKPRLQGFIQVERATREAVEKVLGTLVHCSLAVPEGRSHLPSLASFGASFTHLSNPRATRVIPSRVKEDIEWWIQALNRPFCGSSIAAPPAPMDLGLWVDASTSFGIGIVLQKQWCNFQLLEGWKAKGRDIGWAEMVAVELAVLWLIEKHVSNRNIIIRSDNTGVIGGLKLGRSRNAQQNLIIRRITTLLSIHSIWITSVYVASEENIADKPSRGVEPVGYDRSPNRLKLPVDLVPFLCQI